MNSTDIALVAQALLEIALPPTRGSAMEVTRPSMRDSTCARTLVINTLHEVEEGGHEEMVRLVTETFALNPGVEAWASDVLRGKGGREKLKGFLWLTNNNGPKPAAAH